MGAEQTGRWYQPGASGANSVKEQDEFLRKTWTFTNKCKRSSETLPAGNYEYPFETIVTGNTPESVEGLTDTYIIYRMKATIERNVLAQNFVARKQVRIIRTLDTASLELAHAMVSDLDLGRFPSQRLTSVSLLIISGQIRSITLSVHQRKP